jgi:hypothetical protein
MAIVPTLEYWNRPRPRFSVKAATEEQRHPRPQNEDEGRRRRGRLPQNKRTHRGTPLISEPAVDPLVAFGFVKAIHPCAEILKRSSTSSRQSPRMKSGLLHFSLSGKSAALTNRPKPTKPRFWLPSMKSAVSRSVFSVRSKPTPRRRIEKKRPPKRKLVPQKESPPGPSASCGQSTSDPKEVPSRTVRIVSTNLSGPNGLGKQA